MRVLLVALLLLVVAFAGCADGGKDKDGDGSTSTSTSTSKSGTSTATSGTKTTSGTSTSGTGTGAPGANRAPTANLTANVRSGLIPLAVNFTLVASDPDGTALKWSLAFGDGTAPINGTGGFPLNAVHNFTAAGSYLAVLNVTDGKLFATSNVTITAQAPAAGQPITFSGSFSTGDANRIEHFPVAAGTSKVTVHMAYNEDGFPLPLPLLPLGNDMDWTVADPGGAEKQGQAQVGPEPDVVVNNPAAGSWELTLIPYSVFVGGSLDYTVTVTFG